MGEARPRVPAREKAREAFQAMAALERYIRNCGLEQSLIELVKLRASQINGCAYQPAVGALPSQAARKEEAGR